jgi:hypothetical protein
VADPELTPAQQFRREVERLAVMAKARRRWRKKLMRRAIGSWTMVYRPSR